MQTLKLGDRVRLRLGAYRNSNRMTGHIVKVYPETGRLRIECDKENERFAQGEEIEIPLSFVTHKLTNPGG